MIPIAKELKSIKNLPLAVFYVILWLAFGIGAFFLKVLWLWVSVTPFAIYFIVFAIYGNAIVTFYQTYMELYTGVFGVGFRQKISVGQLKKIYVYYYSGLRNQNELQARLKVQYIIFRTQQRIRFVVNKIHIAELVEFRNRIVDTMLKVYNDGRLLQWQDDSMATFTNDKEIRR